MRRNTGKARIAMPAPKPRPAEEKPQFERFLEAVKKIGASETDEALGQAVERIIPPKKQPESI
jgi:hypothetical protein